jgi:hypothetical protein
VVSGTRPTTSNLLLRNPHFINMTEPLKCFTYLVENVPLWIRSLEELEKKIKDRHNEVARVPVPVSQKVRKTGSNESIRPGEVAAIRSPAMEITSAPQADDIVHAQTTQQILLTKRKRKTASLLTSVSTPNKYRSRDTIIVYYDSAVQEAFERLVRNIGMGRNHIRKARMSARMEALTSASMEDGDEMLRLPSRSARSVASSGYGHTLAVGLRSAHGPALRPDPAADGSFSGAKDACTLADQSLDRAQNACEHGAHQFLRDGDCAEETLSAKQSFEEVVKISQTEVARLKTIEDQKLRTRDEQRIKKQEYESSETSMDSHPGLIQASRLGGAHIEADEDGESLEDEFDDPIALPLPPSRRRPPT